VLTYEGFSGVQYLSPLAIPSAIPSMIEKGGLLGVDNPRDRGYIFHSKPFIILSAVAIVLVVIGITVGLSVTLNSKKDEHNGIDRVPIGASKIEGTDVYTQGTGDSVVVVLPDINGLSVNVMAIATFFSEGRFTAIVIDYFNGNPKVRPPANVSLLYATNVITNLYQRGYKSIQVQGYCYGGRVGVSLCSAHNLTKTCVVAHPSSLTNDDAQLIVQPMFFEIPSSDNGFNATYMAPFYNTTLQQRGIPAEFKIYPNTTHGFAVSGTNEQKQICMQDSLNWFLNHK